MEKSGQIQLVRARRQLVIVPIMGRTPILMEKWAEKAKQQMREAQSGAGRVKKVREAKNAEEDAAASTYWVEEGVIPGIPAVSFKAAMTGAIRAFEGITMVAAKTMLFVYGVGTEQLVPLLDAEIQMREDLPRNANGNPDLRYRNQIWPWRAELKIEFPSQRISTESVLALVDEAGRGGVGGWRPSSPKSFTGIYGQWEIDETREVQLV